MMVENSKTLLANPSVLKDAYKDFEKVVVNFNTKQKSDIAYKYLGNTYKLLENSKWKEAVDPSSLCTYISHLCQYIRDLEGTEHQKYLAILCNVHRFITKKNIPIELCSQLSNNVLANPHIRLKREYNNIYWILLVDMISLIELSKCKDRYKEIIFNLLENITKILDEFIIIEFCQEKLPWLVRRLFVIFNPVVPRELDAVFEKIFDALSAKLQTQEVAPISDVSLEEIYKKLLFCFIFINQNISNCDYYSNASFGSALQFSMSIFENQPSYFHHVQALWSVFPTLTTNLEKLPPYSHSFVSDFIQKLNMSIDLKYTKALQEFCLTLKKILTISISNWMKVTDERLKKSMPVKFQMQVLNLVKLTAKIMSQSPVQSAKCSNCKFISGVHDSFQLVCSARQFSINSLKNNMDVSNMVSRTIDIGSEQLAYLEILFSNKCPNWNTFWTKVETDLHNDAIKLYSLNHYEESLKLFKLYISGTSKIMQWDLNNFDMNHLCRVYYNMGICQFDLREYYEALKNCYLSMAIGETHKSCSMQEVSHSNLILRIKAKVSSFSKQTTESSTDKSPMKNVTDADGKPSDSEIYADFPDLTIWKVCSQLANNKDYSLFNEMLSKLNYVDLLLAELTMFAINWPSGFHLGGICKSLQELCILAQEEMKSSEKADELTIVAGKAITIISFHTNKFNNTELRKFIRFTVKLFESLIKKYKTKCKPKQDINITKMLMANVLQASYECDIQERREAQKLTVVTSTFNTLRAPHEPVQHPDDACDVVPTQQYVTISIENDILKPLFHAVHLWREVASVICSKDCIFTRDEPFKSFMEKTVGLVEMAIETLSLHGLEEQSLEAVDVAYTLGTFIDNKCSIIRSIGFLISQAKSHNPSLEPFIAEANKIAHNALVTDDNTQHNVSKIDAVFDYLLDLATYFFNCGQQDKGLVILTSVHNKIRINYPPNVEDTGRKFDDIKCSYIKLLIVQALLVSYCSDKRFTSEKSFGLLSNLVNAHAECSDLLKSVEKNQGRMYTACLRMWLDVSVEVGRVSLSLGLPRRARALLRTPLAMAQKLLLSHRTAEILILLAKVDLAAERYDDCRVKLEGIRHIINEPSISVGENNISTINIKRSRKTVNNELIVPSTPKIKNKKIADKQCEMVLDVPMEKYNDNSGSPIFRPSPFVMPVFIDHSSICDCCKCTSVTYFSILVNVVQIQAQLNFKSGDTSIAESYYSGGIKLLKYLHCRLKYIKENKTNSFLNPCFLDAMENMQYNKVLFSECQLLIDAGFLCISEGDEKKAKVYNDALLDKLQASHMYYFLIQFAKEQKMCISQEKIFKEKYESQSDLDLLNNLQKDFSLKLALTPEKTPVDPSLLKTPCNKSTKAIPKGIKKSVVKSLSLSTRKNEMPEFIRPAIKLNLDDDEENPTKSTEITTKTMKSSDVFPDGLKIQKTPAPKLRAKTKLLSAETKPIRKTRASAVKTASLINSDTDKDSPESSIPNSPVFQSPAVSSRFRVYTKKAKP